MGIEWQQVATKVNDQRSDGKSKQLVDGLDKDGRARTDLQFLLKTILISFGSAQIETESKTKKVNCRLIAGSKLAIRVQPFTQPRKGGKNGWSQK